jgi:hypothetical protein
MAGLLPALLITHLVLSPATAPSGPLPSRPTSHNIISSPRESLPLPVHDEATCAFCQAAAFAPHTSRAVSTLTLDVGDEQRIQLSHDNPLISSASARPARSRAPPVTRSV